MTMNSSVLTLKTNSSKLNRICSKALPSSYKSQNHSALRNSFHVDSKTNRQLQLQRCILSVDPNSNLISKSRSHAAFRTHLHSGHTSSRVLHETTTDNSVEHTAGSSSTTTTFDNVSRPASENAWHKVEDIMDNIIVSNDEISAINKPYGLSVFGHDSKSLENTVSRTEIAEGRINSLVEALPTLREKLGQSDLDIGLSLKSFYSGVVLLSTTSKSKDTLSKVISTANSQSTEFLTYLAVTTRVPQCSHGSTLTANISRERLHGREMSVISEVFNHSASKRGTLVQVNFTVKPLTVSSTTGAALVQISLNKDKWEAVEVLMSHFLSPVIGDYLYSGRTLTVCGLPFPTSPHSAAPGSQRLPQKIKELLASDKDLNSSDLPLLVHRQKVVLHKFPTKLSPPLEIKARPPSHFIRVLQLLELYDETLFR